MKHYLITLILFITMNLNPFSEMFGQSYDALWKGVETAQKKDLPQQVISQSQKIFDKASKEKNYPQMMKSWITLIETKCNLDPDSFRIANFPPIPHEGPIHSSIYNAIMGSAYLIMKDTNISEDDAETQEDYNKKARECFEAALSDKEALANESATNYEPLINKGEDSRLYNHDLLSLIVRFILDHSEMENGEKAQLCSDLAAFYQQSGNREAYTLMTLKKLKFLYQHEDFNLRLKESDYTKALKDLLEESKDLETGADIAAEYIDKIDNEDERLDFARWAEEQYKTIARTKKFRSIQKQILNPSVSLGFESNALANHPIPISITAKNVSSVAFEVRKYNGRDNKTGKFKIDGALILQRTYTLCDDAKNVERKDKGYSIAGEKTDSITLPAGHYVYIATSANDTDIEEVSITSLRLFAFALPGKKTLLQVVDNETGRPVPDAVIEISGAGNADPKQYPCNKNGEVIYENQERKYQRGFAFLPGKEDKTEEISFQNYWNEADPQETEQKNCSLFTDREIYRPGQTVHVCGIFYTQKGDTTQVLPNHTGKISLTDANYRTLYEQEVKSNDLGSFDVDFVLPKDILLGRGIIGCDGTQRDIRIEEYKRPTFTVEAQQSKTDKAFTFGDTIQIEALAKTYSGVPVQGAKVHYRIESAEVSFWHWFSDSWDILAEGDTLSDETGKAVVDLFLDAKDLVDEEDGLVRYRVSFDVIDQAGETQSSSFSISVSPRTFGLHIDAQNVVDLSKKDNTFTIRAINANQEPVAVSGTYTIYNKGVEGTRQVFPFTSNQKISLPADLAPGTYRIHASAFDKDSTEISCDKSLEIYNSQKAKDLHSLGKTRGTETFFFDDFIYLTQGTFSEEQPAEVFFSPSEEDVNLGYMILSNTELIEHKQVTIGREQYRLTLPYENRFGDGVTVLFWYVRNGHLLRKKIDFSYQRPEKNLKLSWSTFRDKLYPGQQEEWTLNIQSKDGKPVDGAEFLASMYDASLDQLAPHSWNFYLNFGRYIKHWYSAYSSNNRGCSLNCSVYVSEANNEPRKFDELTEYIHDRWARAYGSIHIRGSRPMMMANRAVTMDLEDGLPLQEMSYESISENVEASAMAMDDGPISKEKRSVNSSSLDARESLRTNFAETAFFYPHLLSNAQGNVKISFTLPESLTEWKFLGLAHTKEMDYGMLTGNTVARKDFMVQPNLPRFVREGDKAVISARIINMCDHELNGTAQMRLLDPETEQPILTTQQSFSVSANQTTSVSFEAEITDQYPMLICEVVGAAKAPSLKGGKGESLDGERSYLPVLSSKKYITEAIPFYVTSEETEKHIDVSSLFNNGNPTATHRRMVLEFTEHPEWTVIEALEGIKLPEYDNAPAFAASLYANTMAQRLAKSIPGFQEALEYAKNHNIEASSPLEDNQDLKELVLKESPWLRDALAEKEQRQHLLDLFNDELMQQRIDKAKEKLQKLQLNDGSWSWFEGMSGNYYMTLSVCQSLALLQPEDEEVFGMLQKGLAFLDKKELENYELRLKHKYSLEPNNSDIEYLYICSFSPDREVSKPVQKMREVYLKRLEKNVRDLTILGRSQAACILRAFKHTKAADEFLESSIEYTITKPGMGRYYATDAAYYSWCDYRIPTQLATMRALRESSREDRSSLLNEMQLWLIRQKQGQKWDSPMNTIGAVEEIMNEPSYTEPSPDPSHKGRGVIAHSFVLDGTNISTEIDTTKFLAPQLGYIRTELDSTLCYQNPKTLQVITPLPLREVSGKGSGALYSSYLSPLDQLQQQTTGELKVAVKLIASNDSKPLKVGDKVILRVILTADRDMDFVQVKMQRPACFEPEVQYSGYRWMNGRGGYVAQHDASTDIFFDTFKKGTMTYDIPFHIDRTGEYLTGVTTAQCAYAPEFSAHTGAIHVVIKK